jgi:peptide deformylase
MTSEPLDQAAGAFAAELARWRVERGLTKKQLAVKMGFDPSYVSHVESQRHRPTGDFARRAEAVLRTGGTLWQRFTDYERSRRHTRVPERAGPVAGRWLPPGTGLVVERESALLVHDGDRYRCTVWRDLYNAGADPVTRYPVRIAVDRYPDDPERSNAHYRRFPLTFAELSLVADCAGEPMCWRVHHDRDAFKEIWLLFENEDSRFPLYPGRRTTIRYTYEVDEIHWGQWFQRAVRLPTYRLEVRLDLPAGAQPAVWGTESTLTAERVPVRTPIAEVPRGDRVVFEWATDSPPLHARYRLEWLYRVEAPSRERDPDGAAGATTPGRPEVAAEPGGPGGGRARPAGVSLAAAIGSGPAAGGDVPAAGGLEPAAGGIAPAAEVGHGPAVPVPAHAQAGGLGPGVAASGPGARRPPTVGAAPHGSARPVGSPTPRRTGPPPTGQWIPVERSAVARRMELAEGEIDVAEDETPERGRPAGGRIPAPSGRDATEQERWRTQGPSRPAGGARPVARPSERMAAAGIIQRGEGLPADPVRRFDLPTEAAAAGDVVARLGEVLDRVRRLHPFGKGVGLAAPQIGIGQSAAVVVPPGDGRPIVLVNPRTVGCSADSDERLEGCLSFFDVRGAVRRPLWLEVEHETLAGARVVTRFVHGLARLVAHEIDHLEGRLYTERMAPGARLVPVEQYDGTGEPWRY